MKLRLLFLALAFSLQASSARSETIQDALMSAYRSNAGIRSSEAQVRVMSEAVTQAEAKRLPSLTATAGGGRHADTTLSYSVFGPPSTSDDRYNVRTWQANLTQPLYRGGALVAGIEKAEADTAAQEAALAVTLQSVLLNAASAYIDTLRARADLAVTEQTVQLLTTQKEAVARALARQDSTGVDLDQAIGRLEEARALHHQSVGLHEVALSNYRRWIGYAPAELVTPVQRVSLPASREETIRLAERASPAIRQAMLVEQSVRSDIDIAKASTLPSVSLIANYSNELDRLGANRGETNDYSVIIQVNIPLYQGGAPAAGVRTAQAVHRQRRLQVEQTRNQAMQSAANAWDARVAAQADLNSRLVQSQAAGVALEGLQRQQARGLRSILDVLNGHQERLKAQLAENKARRDLAVSEYLILAAIGRLNLEGLQLPAVASVSQDGTGTKRWSDFNAWSRE